MAKKSAVRYVKLIIRSVIRHDGICSIIRDFRSYQLSCREETTTIILFTIICQSFYSQNVDSIPTMQFLSSIHRNTEFKSYIISLTESVPGNSEIMHCGIQIK